MSMRQSKGKQTKGKQKIEMKKVETYGDRMITFSKRKAGIYKKINEIVTMCGVEAAFLVFSQAGKPYTFANPSMDDLASRLMNPRREPSVKDNTGPLLEAYKKRRNEDLMKEYLELTEQLEMETEKLKILKESSNENESFNQMWWNIPSEGGLSVEDMQRRHQAFSELHDSLCDLAFIRLGDGSSSGRVGRGPFGGAEA